MKSLYQGINETWEAVGIFLLVSVQQSAFGFNATSLGKSRLNETDLGFEGNSMNECFKINEVFLIFESPPVAFETLYSNYKQGLDILLYNYFQNFQNGL